MLGLGIVVAFAGYTVFYYGLTQVQGGNWGLFDLAWPSYWTPEVAATQKDTSS